MDAGKLDEMSDKITRAHRVLQARDTDESHAMAALLISTRGVIYRDIREGRPKGILPYRVMRVVDEILDGEAS